MSNTIKKISSKEAIESRQASALKAMLQTRYNCKSDDVMEINNKQIIQLENTDKQDYYNIEKDVTKILTNVSNPIQYQVTFNGKDTTVIALKALA